MSDHIRQVLQFLRVYGPCSVRTLVIKMHGRWPNGRKSKQERTYRACYQLSEQGLACHLGEALWDVSDKGRELLLSRQVALFAEEK